jgi:hypothetical protein
LPPELRVNIYRYCFKVLSPIEYRFNFGESKQVYYIEAGGPLPFDLLSTCKQIRAEGEQVLHGDNPFHVWHGFQSFAMFYLPGDLFRWIKELRMIFPTVEESFSLHDFADYYPLDENTCHRVPTPDYSTLTFKCIANQVLHHLLRTLSNVPCLRKLYFMIPSHWTGSGSIRGWRTPYNSREDWDDQVNMIDDCVYYDEYLGPIAYLRHVDAWNALETCFGREISFHVSVTRIYEPGSQGTQSKAVERLLKNAKQHLEIWDQREAEEIGRCEHGEHKPSVRVDEDPDEIIRDIGGLFI